MADTEDKQRERWQDKRKKSYDWKRMVIMVLALVAIFIVINKLNKVGDIDVPATQYTTPDSVNTPKAPVAPAEGANP